MKNSSNESSKVRDDLTVKETDQVAVNGKGCPIYEIGTLRYTLGGLIILFVWMLWGDFWFTMMNLLIPRLLPLSLKEFNASNATMGLLVGSLAAAANMVINPIVSFRSDRTRTRFGRRIPYLVFSIPFVAIFMICIGWAPTMLKFLPASINPVKFGLGFIAVFVVSFQLFNMIVGSIFYYLFADVVPEKFMGRFTSLFKLVGAASGFIFNRYIFGLSDRYMPWIYTIIALIYLFSMLLMCWRVKEGQYPPPSDDQQRVSKFASIKLYFKECFSISFYRWFFLGSSINAVAIVCRETFNVFFAEENLKMSRDAFGKVMGWYLLVGLFLYIPIGWLVDKFSPIRVYLFGVALAVLTNVLGFFLIQSERTFLIFTLLLGVVYAIEGCSKMPMFIELLPKERFGQFCSAQAMFQSVILIAASYGGGLFIDLMGDYRAIYSWYAAWMTISLVACIIVYRGWKRHGGDESYQAPMNNVEH